LRITYKDAGGAEEEGHPVEEDHAEAPDQPGPSGVQTGPANNSHASGQHAKQVRRQVCVKSEQPDEAATSFSGVSQGTGVAATQSSNRATAFPSNRTTISSKATTSQNTQATSNENNRAAASHQASRASTFPSNRAAASQSNRAVGSQSGRAATSTSTAIPGSQPAERPADDAPTSGSLTQAHRESAASASGHRGEPKTENGSGPSAPASSDDDHGNHGQEPTAADLMRVLYERQVEDKQKEIDALRTQLRMKDADLEAERATCAQVHEENARLKQENAKKDKTIVDLTVELFELKRSK
ncbi:hypothetical protein AAVH_37285, partial [Aphelenchoides avenae]